MSRILKFPSLASCHSNRYSTVLIIGMGLLLSIALISCAPGNPSYTEAPAGFWAGLWHGLIMVATFVISLFSDGVRVYEASNTGGLYNLGFVVGAAIFFGGCGGRRPFKKKEKSPKEREWEDISERVEEKIRKGIKNWLEESGQEDKEWAELGDKIEEKIKRELRKWAEK